jgi:hypothetical protein
MSKALFLEKCSGLKRKLSKENVLNFVTAHPRLVSVMVGIGISFTFSFVGKPLIHEILNPAYAVLSLQCQNCGASDFAPGHEAISPGDAKDFAPGELDKSPGDAQNLAPGHVFKKEIP